MKRHGSEELLGAGGELGNKGEPWHADDGTHGVTRSFHPKEQIRFSWHASADAPMTMVEVDMRATDTGATELVIRHDRLPADADVEQLSRHWDQVLVRVAEHAAC
ncbi:MAG: SRPBCC domain-containing protein [Arachnia sp.]